MKFYTKKLLFNIISILLISIIFFVGCSANHKTTTKTEISQERGSNQESLHVDSDNGSTVKQTTTTEEVSEDRHHGIFGIIGDIIALPFRAVGALFSAIF